MIRLRRRSERKSLNLANSIRFLWLCRTFSTLPFTSSAQEAIDTVIIEKETVVVKENVEVELVEYEEVIVNIFTKIFYNPGYGFSRYSFADGLAQNYKDDYSCSYQNSINHGLGIDLGIRIEALAFQIGVRYDFTSVNFYYTDYTPGSLSVIQNNNGELQIGEVDVAIDPVTKTFNNTYHSLNIPITLGYVLQRSKHQFTFSVGLNYNKLISYEGITKDYDDEVVANLSDEILYKRMIGAIVDFEYAYRIHKNIDLTAGPYGILNFSNFYNDNNVSYKYYPAGIKLGLKMNY